MDHQIEIVEVGPRDGLQNEKEIVPTEVKVKWMNLLGQAGLQRIEATSFVNPKWIPQLSDAVDVVNQLDFEEGVRYSALVPNLKGMERVVQTPIKEVAVFMSASESHNKSNINKTIDETFPVLAETVTYAKSCQYQVRGSVSTVFGCPFEGEVDIRNVLRVVEALADMGIDEISLADTIGVATPIQVKERIRTIMKEFPQVTFAGHFHDTYGMAVANICAALDEGIRIFDSSTGGLGGCPYAPGATGNVATEDLIYLFDGLGMKTGVNLDALVEASVFIQQHLGKKLPSRVLQAKLGAKKVG